MKTSQKMARALAIKNKQIFTGLSIMLLSVFISSCKQEWISVEKNKAIIYTIDSKASMLNQILWDYAGIKKDETDTLIIIRTNFIDDDPSSYGMQYIILGKKKRLPFCHQHLFNYWYGPTENQLTVKRSVSSESNYQDRNEALWNRIRKSCIFQIDTIPIGNQKDAVMGLDYLDVTILINGKAIYTDLSHRHDIFSGLSPAGNCLLEFGEILRSTIDFPIETSSLLPLADLD